MKAADSGQFTVDSFSVANQTAEACICWIPLFAVS